MWPWRPYLGLHALQYRHSESVEMSGGVLIAGGGLAAQRCCETLRSRGYEGQIRVICAEPLPPYDRPPLSKAVLAGSREPATLAFRDAGWYADHQVELLIGQRAVALDPLSRTVTLGSGHDLAYEHAVIATGSRPRCIPGLERFANIHTLRTAADAERLRPQLSPGKHLVVVGAGFIGLEVAATARARGAEVIVVEAAPAPLTRVLGAELGNWFADLHRSEGTEVLLSAQIAKFDGTGDRAEWIELSDGRRIECDAILIGIGIEPDTLWLEGSGLEPDGVLVDARGQSGAPGVYAAGDAARAFDPELGEYVRSEHWEAAARQGAQVARAILAQDPLPPALPSFWTDQYGLRIQTVGDTSRAGELAFDGDPGSRDFSVLMLREGVPVAGMAVGRPRAIPALRREINAVADDLERSEDEVLAAS